MLLWREEPGVPCLLGVLILEFVVPLIESLRVLRGDLPRAGVATGVSSKDTVGFSILF